MGFIALKCPSCGADISLDETREFGFCQFCGTKVIMDKQIVEHRGSVSLDRSAEINNLLFRAEEYYRKEDYKTSASYYNRVLDIEPTNITARNRIEKINKIFNTPNIVIRRISSKFTNNKKPMRVTIDDNQTAELNVGDPLFYKLPVGTHEIEVSYLKGTPRIYTVQANKYPKQGHLILQAKLGARITSVPLSSSKLNSKNVDSKSNKGLGCLLSALIVPLILLIALLLILLGSVGDDYYSEEKTNTSAVSACIVSQSANINNQILF